MNDNSFSLDTDSFLNRHLGPNKDEVNEMLDVVGATDLGEFIDQVLPESISLEKDLELPTPSSEYSLLKHLRMLEANNKVFKSYIGLGYYDCITPPVIQRNIFENPGWYTQYTPYQSEISQGRLEALINFQTVITDLTGMEIANASLLDEGTAAAEAMTLLHRVRVGNKKDSNTLFVSKNCFPQTIEILKTRAKPLGIELIIDDDKNFDFNDRYFGAIFQQIDSNGEVNDYQGVIDEAHSKDILVAVIADLLSLAILKPPGEIGVDVVVGSTQRLGVPMGYGGPHAAYFATREEYKRQVPGRIIGVSVDSGGRQAYRMALQTREQHIRREKATSNICTAQSLLAIMAGMYVVYHGPEGLKRIANRIRSLAYVLKSGLSNLGYPICNTNYFDT
ncbi:MAG: glycine dehydrogenase (aminomethyl-transferring), partial [Thermodesulfobacteriota bacterium]